MLSFSQLRLEVAEMKYTIILIGALIVWAQLQFGLISALFLFLVAGVVPGTALFVPPMVMMALLALMALLLLRWAQLQELPKQVRQATSEVQSKPANEALIQVESDQPTRRRFTHLQA